MVSGVKGHPVIPLIDELTALRVGGHLREDELSASLLGEDLGLLEQKLIPED